MPNHTEIFNDEADKYDLLISKQPDLQEVIESIRSPRGLDVIDLGAGTGRLTIPIAKQSKSVTALDASAAMLEVTASKLRSTNVHNWTTKVSDHRHIQAEDHSADMLVSGWSICYVASSNVEGWEQNIAAVMNEIERVLRPGGTAIIFETMGTGAESPAPPGFLTGYYSLLERVYGFRHKWIRMDYRFDDPDQAAELMKFFFGDELSEQVLRSGSAIVPECAGVWWRNWC
jgi:ubiquinone/menaquinone biosynthesis C-methylase UbiE